MAKRLISHPAQPAVSGRQRCKPDNIRITVEISKATAALLKRFCVEPRRELGSVVEDALAAHLGGSYWVAPPAVRIAARGGAKPVVDVDRGTAAALTLGRSLTVVVDDERGPVAAAGEGSGSVSEPAA